MSVNATETVNISNHRGVVLQNLDACPSFEKGNLDLKKAHLIQTIKTVLFIL